MGMFDVLAGGRRGGMSPIALAVLGTIAYKALKNKGGRGGGFGSTHGAGPGTAASPQAAHAGMTPAGASPSGGGLGGLLGGLGGGGLGSGLRDLLDRFRQSGHDDKAQSWVSTGENRPIAANEMEQVLGAERIEW